jgi:hypothetical protein
MNGSNGLQMVVVAALISVSGAMCQAGTIAFSFSSSNPLTTICCGTYGFQFTPTTNVLVDSVGYLDIGQDGLAAGHQVGIWNSGGTLLTSATVTTGDSTLAGAVLDGSQFRYTSITPLLLSAGQTYTIGGEEDASDLIYYDNLATQTSNVPSLLSVSSVGYYFVNNGFVDPTNTIGNHYDVVNFTASAAVPEPSTTVLMIVGLAGVLAATRFRRPA